ncbi:T9SS type A sorting domain-containing protein [Polaribacter sp. Hel_I_88]|uniref:T9SS type A sorting domain-containing protein n=1 Tax=Polaribacter sp. Hel_I_88 TaxID=1250006 RepID=UPI00068EF6DB|nr:T9SS type A sorting domain-containing protein [Polaribacter sp. Hel_I_88]
MKKNYLFTLIFTFCFSFLSFGQTEIFNLAGGGALPTGWVGTNNVSTNDIDKGSYYVVDAGSPSDIITSTSIDLSSYATAEFKLDVASFGSGTHNQAKIEVSTDGGTTFNDLGLGTVTTSSSYIDGGTFTISSLSNQVQIRISNNGESGRGVRLRNISLNAFTSDPTIAIISPEDNAVFPAETTTIPISFNVLNFTLSGDNGSEMSDNSGDGYILGTLKKNGVVDGTANIFSTTGPDIDNAEPGTTYEVTAELVDNSGASLSPKVESTITFYVEFPCNITLDAAVTLCDANTTGEDTYNVSIPFTGGNTSTYTLTSDFGTIGGDNPSTSASGTITISNIPEGTDIEFTLKGDVTNSNCDITRSISSAVCLPDATCSAVGALIITEIMQNPSAVSDDNGEYFEVYNTTNSPIELQGWTIKSLTTDSKDDIIKTSLIVPANGYVVFGENADISTNGGVTVDYQYDSKIFLGNGSDSIALECGGNIIDGVSWDDGATFPDPNGASMELATDKYSATDNDNGANWGEATQEIIANGDLGTPGAANSFTLSIVKNEIEGFATYPNPVTNKSFTITTNSTDKKEVEIYNVLGKKVFATSFSDSKSTFDIPTISAGLYILKVTEGTKTATSKLVIK